MKKLSKNFVQNTTVEAMAAACTGSCSCTCSCATGSYCQCNTTSDYGGYQYVPAKSSAHTAPYNSDYRSVDPYLVQFDGIV